MELIHKGTSLWTTRVAISVVSLGISFCLLALELLQSLVRLNDMGLGRIKERIHPDIPNIHIIMVC